MMIEMSKKEKILFIQDFALELISFIFKDQYLKVALITDKTELCDFRTFNPKNAFKVEGDKYFFELNYYEANKSQDMYGKLFFELSEEQKESLRKIKEVILEKNELFFDDEIVKRVNKKYNSNITEEDLNLYLYELAFKIKQGQQ